MAKFACLLVPTLALAACGTDHVAGSVSGTIHGQTFSIHDAASGAVTVAGIHGAAIVLATSNSVCNDATMNIAHENEKAVILFVSAVNGASTTAPIATGAYAIYTGGVAPPLAATMSARVDDSTCAQIANDGAKATTGSVTLTAISGNRFSGKYDVALDSGDHVTGTFDPEECPSLQNLVDSQGGANCVSP